MPTHVFALLVDVILEKNDIPPWVKTDQTRMRIIQMVQDGTITSVLGDNAKDLILDPDDSMYFLEEDTLVFSNETMETYTVLIQTDAKTVWVKEGIRLDRSTLNPLP